MKLQILTNGSMLNLSHGVIQEQEKNFNSIPVIRPFFEDLKAAHQNLLELYKGEVLEAKIQKQTRDLDQLDKQHDCTIRSLHALFSAAIQWEMAQENPNQARITNLESLKEHVLPEGLAWILKSYEQEAGNAMTIHSRLTPAHQALLEQLKLGETSALAQLDHLAAVGKAMSDAMRIKTNLQGVESSISTRKARNEWIRVVNLIEHVAISCQVPDAKIGPILRPFRTAVAKQQTRMANRSANQDATDMVVVDEATSPDTEANTGSEDLASADEAVIEVTPTLDEQAA